MGLARETASRGSMGIYTQVGPSCFPPTDLLRSFVQIVFATILERMFFHAIPSALSVIGTLMIISCALYVAVRVKFRNAQFPN